MKKGFTAVEVVIVVVLLLVVGLVVWNVTSSDDTDSDETTVVDTTEAKEENEKEEGEDEILDVPHTIPEGWLTINDEENGITYGVDPSWPNEVDASTYKVDENIHVGYGAPVWVRYNSTTEDWETLQSNENNVPVVREDNLVDKSSVLVEEKLITGTYETGDGPGGQLRVLFVSNGSVIQIALPHTSPETALSLDDYRNVLDTFISTVKADNS